MNPMLKKIAIVSLALLLGAGCAPAPAVTSFEECAAAGNPVMESYPRQCRAGGTTFVEEVPEPDEPESVRLEPGAPPYWFRGLVLTLKAIEDSRCPPDVQCVWAGELAAVLDVSLDTPAAEHLEVRLGESTRPQAEAFGAVIRLVAIDEASATVAVDLP